MYSIATVPGRRTKLSFIFGWNHCTKIWYFGWNRNVVILLVCWVVKCFFWWLVDFVCVCVPRNWNVFHGTCPWSAAAASGIYPIIDGWILRSAWLNVNYDTAQWRHYFLWHRHCVGVRPQHLTVLYIYIYIYIIYIWTSINEYEYIIVVQPLRDSIHKNKMSPAKIWQTTILRQLYEWMKGSPVPVYPWPLRYRTTTTTVHIYDIRVYIHTSISLGYIYI